MMFTSSIPMHSFSKYQQNCSDKWRLVAKNVISSGIIVVACVYLDVFRVAMQVIESVK